MATKKQTTDDALLGSIHEILRDRPDLAERIHRILQITSEPTLGGKIRSADEIEGELIEEFRKLGIEGMANWAEGVDSQLGAKLKEEVPAAKMREKKL